MPSTEVGAGTQRASAQSVGQVATLSLAFPGNVSAGNLVVICGAQWNGTGAPAITTTGSGVSGTSWTVEYSSLQSSSASPFAVTTFVAWGFASANGPATVTLDYTASVSEFVSFSIDEFSDVDPGGTVTVTFNGSLFGGGASTTPTASVTPDQPDSLVITVAGPDGAPPTMTVNAPWTEIGQVSNNANSQSHVVAFQTGMPATPTTASITLGSSITWSATSVAFSPAAPSTCFGGGEITVVADPTDGIDTFSGRNVSPRAWLELGFGNSYTASPPTESTGYFALDTANHPASYYGGRKAGSLLEIGTVTRQLSDRFSSYKMGGCSVEVDDSSRFFSRAEAGEVLFGIETGELWQNREGRVRVASPSTIAAAGTPHTLFRGIWRSHESNGLQRTLSLTDILGSEFSDFNLEELHPRRKVKDIFDNAAGIALEAATTDPTLLAAVKSANAKFKENRDKPQPIAYGILSDKTATATATPPITATFTDVYNALNTSVGAGTVADDWAFIIGNGDAVVIQGGGVPTTEQALVDIIGGGDYQMMLQYLSTPGGITITDTGKGKIAPRYVGYYTCADSVVRHAWIVADSAIMHIEGRYIDGVSFNPDDHGYHDEESADWATVSGSSDPFMVIGGQTVSMVFIDQGAIANDIISGSTEFTLSICGREDVGDASGSTINAAPRVIFHLFNQSILQNYTTGVWAAPSESEDGVPWVNSQSFSDCEDIEIQRIGGIGYELAMYLDEAITLRELLARLLTCTDIRIGQNKHGQIIGKHLDDFLDLSTAERFTAQHDLIAPTKFQRKLEELENHVDYDWDFRPADGSFEHPDNAQENALAITINRDRVAKVERRQMFYVLDQTTADDIASRGLSNAGGYVPRYATFTCTLNAISRVELGDVILVTDPDDMGADGDTDRTYWVLGIDTYVGGLDASDPPKVTLFCQDVDRFFASAGRWGDDTLNDYVSESAANQAAYLFWGNAAEQYSNGAPVKRWR